jgi:hypothetical protein
MTITPNPKQQADPPGNAEKDPDDWVTGDEPMTGAQASYLKTLSEESGESFNPEMTKAEASKRIESLRERTGKDEQIAGGNPGNTPQAQEPGK